MTDQAKRIAESLRLCSDAPLKCPLCIQTFGIGCATRLRIKAAEMIERLIEDVKSDDVVAFEEKEET